MIEVVNRLSIQFDASPYNPIAIVNGLISVSLDGSARTSARDYWWGKVDEYGIRNLSGQDALMARLAISLLGPSEESDTDLGDQLSWFLEVLGFLKEDVKLAIQMMESYFLFSDVV